MQRNEAALLEPWLLHHGRIFGFGNLTVIDNGSDDRVVLEVLGRYEALGVAVMRGFDTPQDFGRKGEVVTEAIRGWDAEGGYDFALPLDCDEFVGVLTDRFSLERKDVLAAFETVLGEEASFLTNRIFLNVPNRPGYFVPQIIQRAVLKAGSVRALDRGFHAPVTCFPDRWVQMPLAYLHLHNRPDYEEIRRFARQKLFHLTGGDEEALAAHRDQSSHLGHYFRQDAEAFVSQYRDRADVFLPEVTGYFRELGADVAAILGEGGFALPGGRGAGVLVHRSAEGERVHEFARFDARYYAAANGDVAGDDFYGLWPLLHFIECGWREGRAPHAGEGAPFVVRRD